MKKPRARICNSKNIAYRMQTGFQNNLLIYIFIQHEQYIALWDMSFDEISVFSLFYEVSTSIIESLCLSLLQR